MNTIKALTLLGTVVAGLSAGSAHAARFTAELTELNSSGVSGTVLLELSDLMDTLTVTVNATGFEPNQDHVGHIHGVISPVTGEVGDSVTPTLEQDRDGDGFVELLEGFPVYGPIVLPIETVNTPDGTVNYTQTYDLTDPSIFGGNIFTDDPDDLFTVADLFPLEFREIVYHGLSVEAGIGAGTGGEVDGTGGYLAVLPAAAGEIEPVATPEPGVTAAIALTTVGGLMQLRRRKATA